MSKLELCTELISRAIKCLDENNRECVLERIRELIENNCHNGRVVGKEVADRSREVIRELWFRTIRQEEGCRLLRLLVNLGASVHLLGMSTDMRERWFRWCGIDWEGRATRNDVVKRIEDLLRKKLGWSEVRMCEEVWRFVGVDVDKFRMHGIEPCAWLEGLESLRDLRRPYWFGLMITDMYIKVTVDDVKLLLETTNTIDAALFLLLLSMVGRVSIDIARVSAKANGFKHVKQQVLLTYRVSAKLPWPTKPSTDELERILNGFSDEELAEFVAGAIDGDGEVRYEKTVRINIFSINSLKSEYVDVLKEVLARRFGIEIKRIDRGLEITRENAVRLLRRIVKYMHHPLRRLRAELILALYDGRISLDEFRRLYEQIKYKRGKDDIKRNRGLEALVRAAPQTHTRGGRTTARCRPA